MKKAALLIVLVGCNAGAIDSPDEADQTCDGNCIVVTRDNPVLTEGTLITAGEEAFRSVEGPTWEYRNFRFEVAGTTLSETFGSLPPGFRDLEAWPRQEGQWTPLGSATEDVPWEIHGARVGINGLDLKVTKLDAEFGQSPAASTTNVRLAIDIPLVPVQVVCVLPPPSRRHEAWRTAAFTPGWGALMLDDRWQAEIVSGGATNLYRGTWTDRAEEDGLTRWGYQPDEIFAQCGVQFRQIGYFEIEAEEREWDMQLSNCDNIDGALRTLYLAAVEEGVDRRFPTIMGVPRVDTNPPCNGGGDMRAGVTDVTRKVVFVQQYLQSDYSYVLAHELGHVLRLNHVTKLSECSGNEAHNLMCTHAPAEGPELDENQCDRARARARNFFNACIEAEGCFSWRVEEQ